MIAACGYCPLILLYYNWILQDHVTAVFGLWDGFCFVLFNFNFILFYVHVLCFLFCEGCTADDGSALRSVQCFDPKRLRFHQSCLFIYLFIICLFFMFYFLPVFLRLLAVLCMFLCMFLCSMLVLLLCFVFGVSVGFN